MLLVSRYVILKHDDALSIVARMKAEGRNLGMDHMLRPRIPLCFIRDTRSIIVMLQH